MNTISSNTTSTWNILNWIATAKPNKYKYCPECGRSNYEQFKHCPDCGEKLKKDLTPTPTPWYPYPTRARTLEHSVYPSAVMCSWNTLEHAFDTAAERASAKVMDYVTD